METRDIISKLTADVLLTAAETAEKVSRIAIQQKLSVERSFTMLIALLRDEAKRHQPVSPTKSEGET